MPTFEITSPDGSVFHVDGPEGSTEQQAMQQVMAQSAQQPSLTQRIGQDISNRQQMGEEIIKDPTISAIPKAIKYAGKVGGMLGNDVITDTAKTAASYLPGMESYNNAVENTGRGIADSPIAQLGKQAFEKGGAAWDWFKQKAPDAAAVLEGAGGVAILGGDLAATGALAGAARKGINAASDAMPAPTVETAAAKSVPREKIDFGISDKLDEEAHKAYSDAQGAARTAPAVNNFIAQAAKNGGQNAELLAAQGPDEAQKYLTEKLLPFQDKPMSIASAQALDIQLKEAANAAFKNGSNSQGLRYKEMQKALRENIFNNQDPSTFVGNENAFNALQEGNRLKSMAYKASDIENMVSTGMEKAVPSTAIQTQFSGLAKKIRENGPMGFNENQIEAINNAAKSGIIAPTLRVMGSRLIGPLVGAAIGSGFEGGALGELAGAGAGAVAGAPFRAGATALQRMRARKVLETIVNDPNYHPIKSSPVAPEPQRLLAAPDKMSPIPMTPEEISRAQVALRDTGGVPVTEPPSGPTTIRPPASQTEKLNSTLKGIKVGQLRNMQDKLLSGQLSQNKFIEMSRKSFELTGQQALDLAKETIKYRGK